MPRHFIALLAVFLAGSFVASDKPAAPTHEVKLNGHVFTLPTGLTIEQMTKPGLVDRPVAAAFDEQGRLYVTDVSGTNEKVADQLQKKPHRVVRLEDTDGDGVYDKQTLFADKLMLPQGVMWLNGSLYVGTPPSIWQLTDTDNDGVADKREEWFNGKTLTGCANDLHGPYAGPDGWIYWTKGAFAEQRYNLSHGRKEMVTKASHIFRARPDGSGIEPVMTGGMDNPVDVVWLPNGERFFTTTFFQHPGNGLRDGLIHNVYGGVWGKEHAVLENHPRTGPDLMPVLTHMGAAAPCGLHRYEADSLGESYRNNIFAAQFNMAKVSRHVLKEKGATYVSEDSDFVVSSNRDFHPTDVIEDADGSLVIIDTGGWYKLCCPTSQLVKPDVLGAIYRVRRVGAAFEDPRGAKINWKKADERTLTKLLDDPRPVVRQRAVETLPSTGRIMLPRKSPEAIRNAVWAATRLDHPDARANVRIALQLPDENVRLAALHSVALWRDRAALPALLKLLHHKSAHTQRGAAEALGRIGDPTAIDALLEAAGRANDRFLEHAITYALMEINDPKQTAKGLQSNSPAMRRSALMALAGMSEGKLTADAVVRELASPDVALKQAAWYIAGKHPAWGDDIAGHLKTRLAGAAKLAEKEKEELVDQLSRFATAPAIQSLFSARLAEGDADEKRLALRAMGAARFKEVPAKLHDGVLKALDDAALAREAATALRGVGVGSPKIFAKLRELAGNGKLPADVRLAALTAVPGTLTLDDALCTFLCQCVDGERPIGERGPASGALSRSRLSERQLTLLATTIKSAGPMELDALLEPFAKGNNEIVGLALLEALKASPARSALQIDRLRARLSTYPEAVKKRGEELIATLDADAENRKKQLDEILPLIKKADIRRGQLVFNNAKTACAACHAMGYLGGKIGPDLTRIGKIRDERDLLESILFPSASFVRSYEPVQVTTKRGQSYNGLVKRESADELVLTISATEEMRIAKKDIDEVRPGRVSVMPAGLEKTLTAQELADLVLFLKASQ